MQEAFPNHNRSSQLPTKVVPAVAVPEAAPAKLAGKGHPDQSHCQRKPWGHRAVWIGHSDWRGWIKPKVGRRSDDLACVRASHLRLPRFFSLFQCSRGQARHLLPFFNWVFQPPPVLVFSIARYRSSIRFRYRQVRRASQQFIPATADLPDWRPPLGPPNPPSAVFPGNLCGHGTPRMPTVAHQALRGES